MAKSRKLGDMMDPGMRRAPKRKKDEEKEQQQMPQPQERQTSEQKSTTPKRVVDLGSASQRREQQEMRKGSTGTKATKPARTSPYMPFSGWHDEVRGYTTGKTDNKPERSTVDALHETIGLSTDDQRAEQRAQRASDRAATPKPAETKPLSYSTYAGFAGDVRQFTDGGDKSAVQPKPEEKKSGFASFSQDEEEDEGVEEQPDNPKQPEIANTALEADSERQALESAAADAQAAFEKLDSQDKTWWGPMDWDALNRAQAAAAQANKALADYKPFTEWDGRSALIDELNEIDNNSGFITNEAEANAAEARREEIIGQLTAGDEAAGNAPTTYTDNGRARDTFTGATNQYLSGAVNALGTAVRGMGELGESAGNASQYAGYATDEMSAAAIGNGTDEERQAWAAEMQQAQGFGDTVQQAADSLGEEAAKDLAQAKAGLGRLGQAGVDIATNVIQMGYDAGLGGLWAMFLRSAGASAQEARQDGATTGQQIAYGLTKGGIEVATEKLFDGVAGIFGKGAADDVVEGVIRKLTGSDTGRTILRAIAGAGGEGAEEVISDILSPFAEKIYKNESLRELFSGVNGSDVLYDFLIGAAIGGLGGGASIATGQNAAKNAAAREADAASARVNEQMEGVMDALANPNVGQETAAPLDPTQVLAEQVTGQAAPVEGLSAEDQRAEQRAQRVEELLSNPTAETAETPRKAAELPGDIPAPPTAAESTTGESQTFNSEAAPTRATTTAKAAADSLAESVGIKDRGGRLAAGLQEIADYIQSNNNGNGINEEELRAKAEKLAADTLDAIPGQETGDRELYDGIRSMLDGRGFEISDELRGDVADYNAWRKSLFGKLSLVKNGESIDALYAELGTTFGKSLFPDDLTSHADQINRIVDVLDGTRPRQTSFADEVSQESYDEALAELTQQVLDSAEGIESTAAALSDESLSSLEENAPPVTIDGTPVTPSAVQANGPTVERGFAENVRTTESTEEALAKSLGADKVTYERLLNKDVLAAAQGIYDQGYESAKGYLDGVISAAKNGAKLPPEAVPLARMVANEMTRNGDVVGAERLIADVAAELTTAGQLGQVGKILRQSITTPEGKLYGMQKAVVKINEQADGKYTVELPQDLVEAYNSAESDEARDNIISQMQKAIAEQVPASWMEKWNALRYTAMLGNFKTQTRNIAGNLVSMVGRMAKDRVAAVLEYIGYLTSGGQMERTKSVLYDPRLYAEARKDFANVQDEALGEGKYNDYQKQLGKEIEDKRRIFKSRVLEGWRRLTNWAMEQGDVIFSRANYADAMAGWLAAHNIKSLSDATPEQLDRARAYAIQQAQEATFRDSNDFSQTISGLGRNKANTKTGKVLQAVGEGIMPFRKTPANILVRAEEYSPLGVINTIADAVKAVQGKDGVTASDVIDQAAKSLTGSGIMLAGYLLAASGALRGKDRDKEQENFDKLRGEQDWSVTIGDTSYTLDWVSPYSIPLFMGAQLESLASENGLSLGDVLNTFAAIGEPMLEMSMLDGLNDAFEVVQSYTDETPPIALLAMNSLASLLSQGAPTMLGQFERYGEDYRRSTYTDPNGVLPTSIQRKISQTMAKIPGYDYQQQDYIDAWGRKQETPQGAQKVWETFFSPYYSSEDRSTPVDDELQRLYDAGMSKVFPEYASRNPGSDVGRLSPEEYETYATVKGQTSLALVQDFIESEEYKGLDDAERAEIIQNLYKLANNSAKTAVMRQREMIGGDEYAKGDAVTVLTEAGMDPADVASFLIDVSGDGTPKQEDLKAYFTEHPEAESYIAALWDAAGYTKGGEPNTWDMYKGGLTPSGVKALTDAGMKQEDANKLFSSVDTSGNGKATQEEIKAYYAEHPEDADYLKALWESMGWKTGWKP